MPAEAEEMNWCPPERAGRYKNEDYIEGWIREGVCRGKKCL